jgi:hypothetical protein
MNRLKTLLARLLVVTLAVRFVIAVLIAIGAVAAFGILR